jgi:hypothetical protein
MQDAAATQWAEDLAGTVVMTPHLFRAMPAMRYERFHYWVSGLMDGRRVWMDAPESEPTYPHATHQMGLGDWYRVEHRCLTRTKAKILGNRAYCNDRQMVVARTGQEDHVPGLPDPVWEYEARWV